MVGTVRVVETGRRRSSASIRITPPGARRCRDWRRNMGWVTEVEGEIPKEMVGTLLRNGPAMYERDGFVKSYLDGDGMVTSIAIKDGKAYFRNKFVRTSTSTRRRNSDGTPSRASSPRAIRESRRCFTDCLAIFWEAIWRESKTARTTC